MGADLPLLVKAAVTTVVAISILRGFAGPPAAERHPAIVLSLLLAAVALYAGSVSALLGSHEQQAVVLAVLGVEAACGCAWLARAGGDDGGGGGGRGEDDGEPLPGGPGVDWDAFDRARLEWERRRTPTPA